MVLLSCYENEPSGQGVCKNTTRTAAIEECDVCLHNVCMCTYIYIHNQCTTIIPSFFSCLRLEG